MKRKRTYQAEGVERVRSVELLPLLVGGCIVALDVAKEKFVVALATLAGEVVKLFRFAHPTQTREFLAIVDTLRTGLPPAHVRVAMEPTGTYGDAIRQQIAAMGLPVWMVSPQRTHDSLAVFDGVRSAHDPKSATLVAKLCAMGLATEWSPPASTRTRLRALVDMRHHEHTRHDAALGRLEALLARYWPEFGAWLDVRRQKTALRVLVQFTSPSRVACEASAARIFMQEASRGHLAAEVIDGVIDSARSTLGVAMLPEEEQLVRTLAIEAIDAEQRAEAVEKQIKAIAADDEVFSRLEQWMGAYSAAAFVTMCDPHRYDHARKLEKAIGLNLREKSSGEHKGRLSITKRGPGVVRVALYLFALRTIQSCPVVHAWYIRRRGYTEESKKRAVVAVMRKLARAAFYVARGAPFDATKLFDTRRLDIKAEAPPAHRAPFPKRTTQRKASKRTKEVAASASA